MSRTSDLTRCEEELSVRPRDLPADPEADDHEADSGGFAHCVRLGDFWIARYPVTVGQWAPFFDAVDPADGRAPWRPWDDVPFADLDPRSRNGEATRPVVWVSFYDAWHYTTWLTQQLQAAAQAALNQGAAPAKLPLLWQAVLPVSEGGRGWRVNVPSEAEWERSARGRDGRRYPWGQRWDGRYANGMTGRLARDKFDSASAETVGRPSAAGGYQGGRAPEGAEETAGNVWEWTRSLWGTDLENPTFEYPYEPDPVGRHRENPRAEREVGRLLRGGAFDYANSRSLRCANRFTLAPKSRAHFIGFRLFVSPFALDPLISGSSVF